MTVTLASSLPAMANTENTKELFYYGPQGEVMRVKMDCSERHTNHPQSCKDVSPALSAVGISVNNDGSLGDYYAFVNKNDATESFIRCAIDPALNQHTKTGEPTNKPEEDTKPLTPTRKPAVLRVLMKWQEPTRIWCCKFMTAETAELDVKNNCHIDKGAPSK